MDVSRSQSEAHLRVTLSPALKGLRQRKGFRTASLLLTMLRRFDWRSRKDNLGFNYRLPTEIGRCTLSANDAAKTGLYRYPDNRHKQSATGLLDATLSFSPMNSEHWTLHVLGKTLSDEE